jgi:acyl-CoA synthetase (AMP-forming)/AMP-acid ligase II
VSTWADKCSPKLVSFRNELPRSASGKVLKRLRCDQEKEAE